MRYVTVTSSTGTNMIKRSTYNLAMSGEDEESAEHAWDIFSTWLVSVADEIGEELFDLSYIGTIGSLLYDWSNDDNYTELEPDTLTIHAGTVWTAHTIQIWNSFLSKWVTVQSSAYAISRAKCAGYMYDPVVNDLVWYDGVEYSSTRYSPKYSDSAQRWKDAVDGYHDGNIKFDGTADIHFYLLSETDEIIYTSDGQPLFTHEETWGVPLSS